MHQQWYRLIGCLFDEVLVQITEGLMHFGDPLVILPYLLLSSTVITVPPVMQGIGNMTNCNDFIVVGVNFHQLRNCERVLSYATVICTPLVVTQSKLTTAINNAVDSLTPSIPGDFLQCCDY